MAFYHLFTRPQSPRPRKRALAILGLMVLTNTAAADELLEFRALVRKLIALQEARYQAGGQWDEMRPVVEARQRFLQQQKAQAETELAAALEAQQEVQKEQTEAESARNRAHERVMQLAEPLATAERRLHTLAPMLPEPLLESLGSSLENLPGSTTDLTPDQLPDRLRTVFGLMTEIQQFANAVHLVRLRLRDPNGNRREMEVLYLGLGAAFAVSASDTLAASGHPTAKGWNWQWQPDIAEDVRNAVAVFGKQRPAQFVSLPLQLVTEPGGEEQ